MKRITAFLLVIVMLCGINTIAYASDDIKIKVNGEYLQDAQAVLKEGATLLPVRSVGTAVGGTVDWDGETKTAYISKGDKRVTITIGQEEIYVNGERQAISVPAQIIDGRTYVPLRALGEALGCYVEWISGTKTVDMWELTTDPDEYRAWYDIENGMLYLKSNIDWSGWDGYTIILEKEKDGTRSSHTQRMSKPNDMKSTKGYVYYNHSTLWTHGSPVNEEDGIKFYVFEGDVGDKFRELKKENGSFRSAINKMADSLRAELTVKNKITIERLDGKINFISIKLIESEQSDPYYAVRIEEEIKKTGQYNLTYISHTYNEYEHSSSLREKDGVLTVQYKDRNMEDDRKKGMFIVEYTVNSMDGSGNILCRIMQSNGIEYSFE